MRQLLVASGSLTYAQDDLYDHETKGKRSVKIKQKKGLFSSQFPNGSEENWETGPSERRINVAEVRNAPMALRGRLAVGDLYQSGHLVSPP